MEQSKGYIQAVENLAYYIRQLTDDTYSPIMDENPWMVDIEDPDEQLEVVSQYISPEEQAKWDQLDEIFEQIVITYECDPEKLWAAAFVKIIEYDAAEGIIDENDLQLLSELFDVLKT